MAAGPQAPRWRCRRSGSPFFSRPAVARPRSSASCRLGGGVCMGGGGRRGRGHWHGGRGGERPRWAGGAASPGGVCPASPGRFQALTCVTGEARPGAEGRREGDFNRGEGGCSPPVFTGLSGLRLLPPPLWSFLARLVANVWGKETRIPLPALERSSRLGSGTHPRCHSPLCTHTHTHTPPFPVSLRESGPLQPPSFFPAVGFASLLFPAVFVLFSSCDGVLAFR